MLGGQGCVERLESNVEELFCLWQVRRPPQRTEVDAFAVGGTMKFGFSPADEFFRDELRGFFETELPEDWYGSYEKRDDVMETIQSVRRKMARNGWLTMAWPKQYGGQEAAITREMVFSDECSYWEFPARESGIGYLGPALILHGTDEQKRRFLGPISRAEIEFHQGFSEPDFGSDLTGLRTSAVRDGDDYLVNGQKIWGGHIRSADYTFLLVRTDLEAPKHRGISLIVIPTDTPGIRFEEFENMSGGMQNIVYYDNVRVPIRDALIGEENRGWYIGATVLNHERAFLNYAAIGQRLFDDLVNLWRERGSHVKKNSPALALRYKLSSMAIEFEVCRNLAYRVGWMQGQGQDPSYEASIVKIFGSEMVQRFSHVAYETLGLFSQLTRLNQNPRYHFLSGRVEHMIQYQLSFTLMGGTSEIQRDVIAGRGLGLPRN